MEGSFIWCEGITSINFPALTSIEDYGMSNTFGYCTELTGHVSFPSLISIGYYGMEATFTGCEKIIKVSFPSLTFVDEYGLYATFMDCTGITEIHFRADAKSVIENQNDYDAVFGASDATIYFDL